MLIRLARCVTTVACASAPESVGHRVQIAQQTAEGTCWLQSGQSPAFTLLRMVLLQNQSQRVVADSSKPPGSPSPAAAGAAQSQQFANANANANAKRTLELPPISQSPSNSSVSPRANATANGAGSNNNNLNASAALLAASSSSSSSIPNIAKTVTEREAFEEFKKGEGKELFDTYESNRGARKHCLVDCT